MRGTPSTSRRYIDESKAWKSNMETENNWFVDVVEETVFQDAILRVHVTFRGCTCHYLAGFVGWSQNKLGKEVL